MLHYYFISNLHSISLIMNRIYILARSSNTAVTKRISISCLSSRVQHFSSEDSKDDKKNADAEDSKPNDDSRSKKSSDALKKLNLLLKQMTEEKVEISSPTLDLAKPKDRRQSAKVENKKPEPFEKQIKSAAKDVAEKIGGDIKQTESELLAKLLDVSSLSKTSTSSDLSDLIKGMKIDREAKPEVSRADQVRKLLSLAKGDQFTTKESGSGRRPQRRPRMDRGAVTQIQKIDLFGGKGLGIFTDSDVTESEGVVNTTWKQLHEKELRLTVTHPPANYFQQMILWTEQGKIWKFPIDNEQGMEKEQNVSFAEHVFLEKHLEPWCPRKGPIRHFMELVCVGMSKNPYMTVETKKEHIEWYRKYFEDKKKLLQEVGAFPVETKETPKLSAGKE